MADAQPLFMTQRSKVIQAYKDANEPFSAGTKPYKSTVSWLFVRANTVVASSVSWLIARTGQRLEWFGYKLNDVVPGNGGTAYRSATESDTNVSKARTTNGAEDFVIEGMSATHRATRVSYLDTQGGSGIDASVTDPDAVLALSGLCPILDPGALYVPPQIQSPFNLENVLYRLLSPLVAVEFEWDRSKVVKIGTLEQVPEGAANTYLRASGDPSTNDRYRIPEGYLWRREGQPDSEFIVRGTLTDPVACPILNVAMPTSGTAAVNTIGQVLLDNVLRLHGLSVKLPTRN